MPQGVSLDLRIGGVDANHCSGDLSYLRKIFQYKNSSVASDRRASKYSIFRVGA